MNDVLNGLGCVALDRSYGISTVVLFYCFKDTHYIYNIILGPFIAVSPGTQNLEMLSQDPK